MFVKISIAGIMDNVKFTKEQMQLIEAFAKSKSEETYRGLKTALNHFYADLLQKEMERLWDNGTLNQEKLDSLNKEHLRTPYRA